ncbi:MAG: hypothetical protein ACLQNE_45675 [Thermoguttaceae bacterium]|jgi:hypothetical protein
MAITCPRCGAEFDATLFEFDHRVRCRCGAEVEYPGANLRAGHTVAGSAPPENFVLPESDCGGTGQRSAIRPPRPSDHALLTVMWWTT